MKYIRTKDGRIIDLTNWFSQETICANTETNEVKKDVCYQRTWFEQHGDTCKYKTEYISHNSQVLKQANTIEELCDEFVIRWSNKTYCDNLMKTLEQARYWLTNDNNAEIYGAIWTDKGLIYVAKMDEKGELCLI